MIDKPSRSDRLPPDQVERVLQAVRPRPSRLTAEAVLERSAASDASSPRLRPGRPVSTIITSWSCGAAVGALVTYGVMLTLASPVTPPDTVGPPDPATTSDLVTTSTPVTQPHVATDESPPSNSVADPRTPDVLGDQPQSESLIAFADPLWDVRTSMPPGGFSLRVGLYLDPDGGRGRHPEVMPRLADNSPPLVGEGHRPNTSRPTDGDTRGRVASSLDSPGMTRQRMLAELIAKGI